MSLIDARHIDFRHGGQRVLHGVNFVAGADWRIETTKRHRHAARWPADRVRAAEASY